MNQTHSPEHQSASEQIKRRNPELYVIRFQIYAISFFSSAKHQRELSRAKVEEGENPARSGEVDVKLAGGDSIECRLQQKHQD
jgi:hypothetical protein